MYSINVAFCVLYIFVFFATQYYYYYYNYCRCNAADFSLKLGKLQTFLTRVDIYVTAQVFFSLLSFNKA